MILAIAPPQMLLYVHLIFVCMYIVMGAVVMTNLLIAMMASTYEKVRRAPCSTLIADVASSSLTVCGAASPGPEQRR
jgi:hypothetical protein